MVSHRFPDRELEAERVASLKRCTALQLRLSGGSSGGCRSDLSGSSPREAARNDVSQAPSPTVDACQGGLAHETQRIALISMSKAM